MTKYVYNVQGLSEFLKVVLFYCHGLPLFTGIENIVEKKRLFAHMTGMAVSLVYLKFQINVEF